MTKVEVNVRPGHTPWGGARDASRGRGPGPVCRGRWVVLLHGASFSVSGACLWGLPPGLQLGWAAPSETQTPLKLRSRQKVGARPVVGAGHAAWIVSQPCSFLSDFLFSFLLFAAPLNSFLRF